MSDEMEAPQPLCECGHQGKAHVIAEDDDVRGYLSGAWRAECSKCACQILLVDPQKARRLKDEER